MRDLCALDAVAQAKAIRRRTVAAGAVILGKTNASEMAAAAPAPIQSSQPRAVGTQIIDRHLDDRAVLRAAAAFEAVLPWHGCVAPMVASFTKETRL